MALYKNNMRETSANVTGNSKQTAIADCLHDIKSSLQSLVVANEMALEPGRERERKQLLLRMLSDIENIKRSVDIIEDKRHGEEL